jgi:hypothetical protein
LPKRNAQEGWEEVGDYALERALANATARTPPTRRSQARINAMT